MIHLFDKVYLNTDTLIDHNTDRIVISNQSGYPLLDVLQQINRGLLLGFATSYDEFVGPDKHYKSFIDVVDDLYERFPNKKIVIYADEEAFLKIYINWLKIILKQVDTNAWYDLYMSYVFRHRIFGFARHEKIHRTTLFLYDKEHFKQMVEQSESYSLDSRRSLIAKIKQGLSVEFLLASYFVEGTYKEELKDRVKLLSLIDLEKYLYEVKEMLVLQILNPLFQEKINFNVPVNFSNLNSIFNAEDKWLKFFFNPSIWVKYEGLGVPSSSKTINFSELNTEENIETLRQFIEVCGSIWEEEYFYRFTQSDRYKLQFIPYLIQPSLSDEALENILNFEIQRSHAAGLLSPLEVDVNKYLVDHIFNCVKTNRLKLIEPYCLL